MARILVIDDDANVRDILRRMLSNQGYDVLVAADGNEGIWIFRRQLADEQPVDLVVTDILMPEKEGLETILELRRELPDVKIIVISGGGSFGEPGNLLHAARTFGAHYSFRKPIPREKLVAAVEDLIGPGSEPATPNVSRSSPPEP